MGQISAQVQNSSQPSGKMAPTSTPTQQVTPAVQPSQGKGASGQAFTYSPTSGQPQYGTQNQYANTVGQWDNARISQPNRGFGKGKG